MAIPPFEEVSPPIGFFDGRGLRGRNWRFQLGEMSVSFDAGVDLEVKGDQEPIGLILIKYFDPLGVFFLIEGGDGFFDQLTGGFEDLTVKGDRSVAVDFSEASGAEEIREVWRRGPQKMEVWGVTIQRGLG